MNPKKIVEKFVDFFINFAVAAFAIAAFQNRVEAAMLGASSLLMALGILILAGVLLK